MNDDVDESRFEVSRTIVLRVAGPIQGSATAQLRRMLEDLIDDHGIVDLVVDFSLATQVTDEVTSVLDWAQQRMHAQGGRIELRLPAAPTAALIEASGEIASFVPIDDDYCSDG